MLCNCLHSSGNFSYHGRFCTPASKFSCISYFVLFCVTFSEEAILICLEKHDATTAMKICIEPHSSYSIWNKLVFHSYCVAWNGSGASMWLLWTVQWLGAVGAFLCSWLTGPRSRRTCCVILPSGEWHEELLWGPSIPKCQMSQLFAVSWCELRAVWEPPTKGPLYNCLMLAKSSLAYLPAAANSYISPYLLCPITQGVGHIVDILFNFDYWFWWNFLHFLEVLEINFVIVHDDFHGAAAAFRNIFPN